MTAVEFFAGHPQELCAYRALEEAVRARIPDMTVRMMKSCVAFDDGRPFCYVSRQRCGERKDAYILVSFGLDAPIADSRIAAAVEPYPNRWTHHVPVGDPEEVDAQLLAWIDWAHAFSKRKCGRHIKNVQAD